MKQKITKIIYKGKHITNICNIILLLIYCAPFKSFTQVFVDKAHSFEIVHSYDGASAGGGVSTVDFNQDGWDDISFASAKGENPKFYVNNGDGSFMEIVLIDNNMLQKQLLWNDFDNDGDLDLFVAAFDGVNKLYENQGNLELIDVSILAGLPQDTSRTIGANFADYNRDGFLDLYYSQRKIVGSPEPNQNRMFKNQGDGTFIETTFQSNTTDLNRLPFCSVFVDFNNDKWPDIYIANDRKTRNTLFVNQKGFFVDGSELSGSDLKMEAMSTAIGDFNRDGYFDAYISNNAEGNKFLINTSALQNLPYPTFNESATDLNIEVFSSCWGSQFLDQNNDGRLDLYVSSALVGSDTTQSSFFLQEDNYTFSHVQNAMIGDTVKSYNNAIADFNNDGYPDIAVLNQYPFNVQIWENQKQENNWIKIKLRGIISNQDAIGTRLELFIDTLYQQLYTTSAEGFMGQNSRVDIFGLGLASHADSLIITWPTGHIDRVYNLSSNQLHSIYEGQTTNDQILVDDDVEILNPVSVGTINANHVPFPLHIFPNPTDGTVFIRTGQKSEKFLFDNQGRRILSLGISRNLNLDISFLPTGLYYLCIVNQSDSKFHKIIKH